MIPNAQYSDGLVFIRYYQPVPKYVKIGSREYVCDIRHGVSMLLVTDEEVPALLAHEGGCCGGKRKVFSLASEGAVKVFLTGDR